jgi:DNA-binding LacI/PurR family transcriptional regulator
MKGVTMPSKRITSQDVANHAGVSRTTVSLVLNNVQGINISQETRQKVKDSAAALGYVPDASAQALASRRTQVIGLVMTRTPHHIATDAFLPQIISGLLGVVKQNNLRLLIELVEDEHQDQAYQQLARAKQIDGMILATPRIDDTALRNLEEVGIPTVMMGELVDSRLYSVDVDNHAAAEKAVRYLLELGHRQIACITNAPASYTAVPDRIRGYKDALLSAGIEPDESLLRYGDFDPKSGYNRMKSLLACGRNFTAAFVTSDNVAIGAKSAIREAGLRVPDDISMMGFDDIPWAQYSDPPLTTIRVPAQDLARQACLKLLEILKGTNTTEKKLVLETELVVRKSCREI